jgi:energy-coupling factor transporter ATP-binding protein EcfA2
MAIHGETGVGKSTMMQRLAQMLRPSSNDSENDNPNNHDPASSEVRRRRHPYLWTEEPVHLAGILTHPILELDEFQKYQTIGVRVQGIQSQKSIIFGHVHFRNNPQVVQCAGLGLDVPSFEQLWMDEVNFALQPPPSQKEQEESSVQVEPSPPPADPPRQRHNVVFLVDTVSHLHGKSNIFFSSLEQLLTLPSNHNNGNHNNIAVIAALKPGIHLNYASDYFTACAITKSNREFFIEKIILPWLRPKFQSQLQKYYNETVITKEEDNPAERNNYKRKYFRRRKLV